MFLVDILEVKDGSITRSLSSDVLLLVLFLFLLSFFLGGTVHQYLIEAFFLKIIKIIQKE